MHVSPSSRRSAVMLMLGGAVIAYLMLDGFMQLSQAWGPPMAGAHGDPLAAPVSARIIAILVSSAAVSFFALAYLVKPGGGRDWRSMGLVQAFIVALYAEMYGFPLTVYLLASALGLPSIPGVMGSLDGHLVAQALYYAFGLNMQAGSSLVMAVNSVLMALAFFLIVTGWRQIHGAQGRLVTGGIYAVVRHPQYSGILLLTFAMILHWPTLPTVIMYPAIVWTYVRLARREEKQAQSAFGQDYVDYRNSVPAFFPILRRTSAFGQ